MTELTQTIYKGWVFDNVLTPDQCQYYIGKIRNMSDDDRFFQDIIEHRSLARKIWKQIKEIMPKKLDLDGREYRLIGLSDYVTVSRHKKNIGIHKDKDKRSLKNGYYEDDLICLYKVAIYLNDLSDPNDLNDTSGGTVFYDKDKNKIFSAKPQTGRCVVFDMREWHSGDKIPNNRTKYMIGVRLLYQEKCYKCNKYH